MRISSKLMKEAHKLTKEIKREYPEVNYSFQLGICIKYLLSKKEENGMKRYDFTQDYKYSWNMEYEKEDAIGVLTAEEYEKQFNRIADYEYNFVCDINGLNRGMNSEDFNKLLQNGIIKETCSFNSFKEMVNNMRGLY